MRVQWRCIFAQAYTEKKNFIARSYCVSALVQVGDLAERHNKCMKNGPNMLKICINVRCISPLGPEGCFLPFELGAFCLLIACCCTPSQARLVSDQIQGCQRALRLLVVPYAKASINSVKKDDQLDGSLHCLRQMPRLFVFI